MQLDLSVFDQYPTLRTNRLTLRQIGQKDVLEIFKMRASGRINEFIPRPQMISIEHAQALVEKTNKAFEEKTGIGWAGVLRSSDMSIGTIGFNHIDHTNLRAEFGGELSSDYWGC
jgi:[ribosomal protein S5]-alanine N-acetyltransferase